MFLVWQTYGASLFSNGLLLIDAEIMLRSFGYAWPIADPGLCPGLCKEVLVQVKCPGYSRSWLIDPQRN